TLLQCIICYIFFSSRRRHTRSKRDWSSDVCSSDLGPSVDGAGVLVTRGGRVETVTVVLSGGRLGVRRQRASLPPHHLGMPVQLGGRARLSPGRARRRPPGPAPRTRPGPARPRPTG